MGGITRWISVPTQRRTLKDRTSRVPSPIHSLRLEFMMFLLTCAGMVAVDTAGRPDLDQMVSGLPGEQQAGHAARHTRYPLSPDGCAQIATAFNEGELNE